MLYGTFACLILRWDQNADGGFKKGGERTGFHEEIMESVTWLVLYPGALTGRVLVESGNTGSAHCQQCQKYHGHDSEVFSHPQVVKALMDILLKPGRLVRKIGCANSSVSVSVLLLI